MRRERRAWMLLLVLALLLGLIFAASAHSHSCDSGAFCPICQFLSGEWKIVVLGIALVLAVLVRRSCPAVALACAPRRLSLVDTKIRMND